MIGEYNFIPVNAFLFFPPYEQTVEYINGKKQRVIFSGGIDFDEEQKQKINVLKQRLRSHHKNSHLIDYNDDFYLRSLQAAQFKVDETVKCLRQYFQWEKKTLPLLISPKTEQILKQGTLYLSGRDCYYRPIIVVNVKKLLALDLDKEDLVECLSFFFEYIIENFMIEGQIQQWSLIIDLGNASIFSLGKSMLDIIVHLSSVFKVRAVKNYLINCPSSIKILWSTLKSALNEDQIRKISMSEKKYLKPQNFQLINRSQVEEKYGGTHPNIEKFWPIQINTGTIEIPPENSNKFLITESQYEERYNKGQLRNRKIQKKFIKKFQHFVTIKESDDNMTEKDIEEENNMMDEDEFFPLEAQPLQIETNFTPMNFFELF